MKPAENITYLDISDTQIMLLNELENLINELSSVEEGECESCAV